jgi:hypothetical protein
MVSGLLHPGWKWTKHPAIPAEPAVYLPLFVVI